jgi:hypothetical protein
VALEGIVDLDETIVDRAIALEQHLDHAETGVDALKHAMMQVGFGRRHHHRWALHEGRQCGQGRLDGPDWRHSIFQRAYSQRQAPSVMVDDDELAATALAHDAIGHCGGWSGITLDP